MPANKNPNLAFCKIEIIKKPKAVAKNYAVGLGKESARLGEGFSLSIAFHGVVPKKGLFYYLTTKVQTF
jgi:hypothetical protein